MTDEIIREADATDDPFFFFAVSLQNHGPYEPNRYDDPTHDGARRRPASGRATRC